MDITTHNQATTQTPGADSPVVAYGPGNVLAIQDSNLNGHLVTLSNNHGGTP